jgi:hypothetical protein
VDDVRDDAKDIQIVRVRDKSATRRRSWLQRQSWRQQKPFNRKLPLHTGHNNIAVPGLLCTVHNQQIAIVKLPSDMLSPLARR